MSATTTPARGVRLTQAAELYHSDGYTWAIEQADALRRRDFAAIDWDNVIEEIEDVGRREKNHWRGCCARILEHLLKIEHYREATHEVLRHWVSEIKDFREEMADDIINNPGLQGEYETMLKSAWQKGRNYARRRLAEYDESNGISTFKQARLERDQTLPEQCPYRLEDVTAFDLQRDRDPDEDVWPSGVARVLNDRLGADYPVLPDRDRGRSTGWSR
ncbi:MAG: DUF29 domain-containing protein [Bryobacterales bacterium]|nr:DUF29 domain-containing protein [Bryobacterales bacterium]